MPKSPLAGLTTPWSRIDALPWLLFAGSAQVMLLGLETCTRVYTRSVGLPPCGVPLNSRTQPLTSNAPLTVAFAVPLPTFALPHAAIACDIGILPETDAGSHFAAAFGFSLTSSSMEI